MNKKEAAEKIAKELPQMYHVLDDMGSNEGCRCGWVNVQEKELTEAIYDILKEETDDQPD